MRGLDGHADEADDGGVRGLVEVGDVLVEAIDGDGILDEVVGADAEEIDLAGEDVGGDGGAGDLDHGADFHLRVEGDALGAQLGAAFLEDHIGAAQLLDAGDHGIHEFDVAGGAGAEDGAELGLEDIDALEAETDGAPAEEGVELLGHVEGAHELVAAQVEGADDDAVRHGALGDGAIGLVLLLLTGEVGFVEVEEFRAIQADALGAVLLDGVHVAGEFDVRAEDDVAAVERGGGGLAEVGELLLDGGLADLQFAVFPQGLVAGVDDDDAVVAVEQHMVAGAELVADVVEADDGGDVQRPRHDGGVGGLAADVGAEAEDEGAVELRGVARVEVVGEEDVRGLDAREVAGLLAHQVVDDAAGDIVDVQRALAEVGVVDLAEGLGVAVGDALEDLLDVELVPREGAQHFVDERAILDHEEVRVEDARVLRPDGHRDALLHLDDLLARGDEGRLEAGDLAGDFPLGDVARRRRLVVRAVDEDGAARDARRDADALESLLLCGVAHGRCARASVFIELAKDDGLDLGERLVRVRPFTADEKFRALPGREHHQAHDALPVHALAVLFHPDIALEAAARFHKERRGAGMQTQPIQDRQFLAGLGAVGGVWSAAEEAHSYSFFFCIRFSKR